MVGSPFLHSVSARIRLARRAASLTQVELANQLDVGRSAVAQWERADGSRPSATHLAALAQKLNCSFEWIATGRGARVLDPCKFEEGEGAALLRHFAQDDDEERVLTVFRGLDGADREMVLSLANSLSDKAVMRRKSGR